MKVRALTAVAFGLLALCSGCVTGDTNNKSKKPDVMQPGVLPPPQETLKAPGANGSVVPAGGVQAGAPAPTPAVAITPAPATSTSSKFTFRPEKKVVATELAVAWRSKIEYLPDPSRNGAMGAGIAGQMFLYGGPKLEFALADGTLTVDLIDETPRLPGQRAATPERWQFDKNMLRNLRTTDETFGKSYVLFLPWPAYKPDITKVKISARYDPDNGNTLFAQPSTVTLSTAAPTFDLTKTSTPVGIPGATPFGGNQPGGPAPAQLPPIPIGGGNTFSPPPGVVPLGSNQPVLPVQPMQPLMPAPPTGAPTVGAPGIPVVPAGFSGPTSPVPSAPPGLPPIGMVLGQK